MLVCIRPISKHYRLRRNLWKSCSLSTMDQLSSMVLHHPLSTRLGVYNRLLRSCDKTQERQRRCKPSKLYQQFHSDPIETWLPGCGVDDNAFWSLPITAEAAYDVAPANESRGSSVNLWSNGERKIDFYIFLSSRRAVTCVRIGPARRTGQKYRSHMQFQ